MRASCCPDLCFFHIFPDLLPGFVRVWLRKEDTWMRNFLHKVVSKSQEIWHMTATSNFLHSSLSKSMTCDTWLLGQCPLQFLPKSLKHDLWLLGTISSRLPYQNHWYFMDECQKRFSLQFFIKIIGIWCLTAKGNFLHSSVPESIKCDLWLLGAMSFTIFLIFWFSWIISHLFWEVLAPAHSSHW